MIAKKTVVKQTKEAKQVKTIEELMIELATKQTYLLDSKRGHKQGELVNHCILRSTRKEIARLHTAIKLMSISDKTVKQQGEEK
jgi:ribosomal protein L29